LVPETEEPFLNELPVRVELAGSMAAVSRLMNSLPRRSDELQALGLPKARRIRCLYSFADSCCGRVPRKGWRSFADLQASALVCVE
jgi:hypothetical protein